MAGGCSFSQSIGSPLAHGMGGKLILSKKSVCMILLSHANTLTVQLVSRTRQRSGLLNKPKSESRYHLLKRETKGCLGTGLFSILALPSVENLLTLQAYIINGKLYTYR